MNALQSNKRRKNLHFKMIWFIFITLLATTSVRAQNYENEIRPDVVIEEEQVPIYYLVIFFDYKEGKEKEVMNFIRKHFMPVDKKVGRQVTVFAPLTGQWDEMAFFPLYKKPTKPVNEISPTNSEWEATFVELSGGKEKVNAIWNEFEKYVVKTKKTLVIIPKGWQYQMSRASKQRP